MPLHHYLPASFLASFSSNISTDEPRNRPLWAGDKQQNRVFRAPASRLGAEKNLYTIVASGHDPQIVDDTWSGYEGGLSNAIEELLTCDVDAGTWARVLVPFVACMLVRGPDFADRFGRRLVSLGIDDIDGGYTPAANANVARLLELQRLLGPVAVAKWVVVRFPEDGSLLTNDLGCAQFVNHARAEGGMAIPLGPSYALTIVPRTEGRVAVARSGEWFPDIEYVDAPPGDRESLNQAVSAAAQRFIFGPDEEFVDGWLQTATPAPSPPEPGQLGFIGGTLALAHEFTWHRLAPALERDPSDGDPWDFQLDREKVVRSWSPRPFFEPSLPESSLALRREGASIIAEFYDPTSYFEAAEHHDRGVALFESGEYEEAVEALNTSLELLPDRIATLYYKGTALAKMGRHEQALDVYDGALVLDPGNTQFLYNKGIALDALGRPEGAITAYDEALRAEPDHADALTNKGALLHEQGRNEEALEALEAALEVKPNDPDVLTSKGGILGEMGKHGEATQAFGAALEIRPEHEPALRYKISALLLQGKEVEAESHLREGLRDRERLSHKGTLLETLLRDS